VTELEREARRLSVEPMYGFAFWVVLLPSINRLAELGMDRPDVIALTAGGLFDPRAALHLLEESV
jgi:hypothetical protein